MSIAESRPADGDVSMSDAHVVAQEDVSRRNPPHVTKDGDHHVNVNSGSGNPVKSPSQDQSQQLSSISPPGETGAAQEDAGQDKIGCASEDSGKDEKNRVTENGRNDHNDKPQENIEKEKHSNNGYIGINGNTADTGNPKRTESPRELAPNNHPPSPLPAYEPSHTTPPPVRTTSESIKSDKEKARLQEALSQTSPSIAQRVFRDQWRVLLFAGYDENHISFLLRCLLKNSTHPILDRIRRDDSLFKGPLLETAVTKQPVFSKVLNNATPAQLQEYVPQHVLDAAFERRLESIDGRTLLNWLAAHRRLGYEQKDIIDRYDESVVPVLSPVAPSQGDLHMRDAPRLDPSPFTMVHFGGPPVPSQPVVDQYVGQPRPPPQSQPQPQSQSQPRPPPPQQPQPQLQPQPQPRPQPPGAMICPYCQRHFKDRSGYNYHVHKKVCEKEAPDGSWKWMCTMCAQGFTTKQGRDYHELKGVCRDCDIAPATARPAKTTGMSRSPMPSQTSFSAAPIARPPFTNQPVESNPAPIPQVGQGQQAQHPSTSQNTPQSKFVPLAQQPPPPQSSGPGQSAQQSRTPGAPSIPRPPLYTPLGRSKKEVPQDIRQSPSQLPPDVLAALNREILEEDRRYEKAVAEADKMKDPKARDQRLTSLKNGNASKKSQIRKRYGVSLRLRERDKQAMRPSVHKNRIEGFRAVEPPRSSNPQVVVPTTGFSPINASRRPGPSPINVPQRSGAVNGYGSPYGAPPPRSSSRAQMSPYNPTSSSQPETSPYQQNAHRDGSRAAIPPITASGAAVPRNHRYMSQDQVPTAAFGKRRREDDDGGHDPRPPAQPPTFDAILYQGPPPKRPATSTSPKLSSTPQQHTHTENTPGMASPASSKMETMQTNKSTSASPRAGARVSDSRSMAANASDPPGQDTEMNDANPVQVSVSDSAPVSEATNHRETKAKTADSAKKDTSFRVEDGITVISSDSD
ncbi:uncharacterized protein BP5553_02152 [Venustampulla echinocandica]|uniref:Uncharacterized protein n=1 Tax=Venustampulla echinocandica TaxID=2656787 RepID=A0A370U357_9HELO|nr:uncharacterized protein BP5553_02152 [Venustampulla echinocandica]RDL42173.1 hypothetical protein BP5553_02152 [Venustampulla echinocandica]